MPGIAFSKASRVGSIPRSSVMGHPWWNASGHDWLGRLYKKIILVIILIFDQNDYKNDCIK